MMRPNVVSSVLRQRNLMLQHKVQTYRILSTSNPFFCSTTSTTFRATASAAISSLNSHLSGNPKYTNTSTRSTIQYFSTTDNVAEIDAPQSQPAPQPRAGGYHPDCGYFTLPKRPRRASLRADAPIHKRKPQGNNNNKSIIHSISQRDNAFIKAWLAAQHKLLSDIEPGSMTAANWTKAERLLWLNRQHALFIQFVPKRVHHMFAILDRMCLEAESIPSTSTFLPWNGDILGRTLIAWRNHVVSLVQEHNQNHRGGPAAARQLLRLGTLSTQNVAQRLRRYHKAGLFQPHPHSYNILFQTMAQVDDPQSAPHRADEIYEKMVLESSSSSSSSSKKTKRRHEPYKKGRPINSTIDAMVEIWARSGLGEEAVTKVEEYLASLKRWYHDATLDKDKDLLMPQTKTYCAVMETHLRLASASPWEASYRIALNRVKELLAEMKQLYGASDGQKQTMSLSGDEKGEEDKQQGSDEKVDENLFVLNTKVYNRICCALTLCKNSEAADQALALLDEMLSSYEKDNTSILKPDALSFSAVLTACAQAGQFSRVESLLEKMKHLSQEFRDPNFRPSLMTYSSLIQTFYRMNDRTRVEWAFSLLMSALEENSDAVKNVETTTVDGLLMTFAESKDPKALAYMTQLIDRLREISRKPGKEPLITTSSYNRLLTHYSHQHSIEAAQAADQLFQWMENQKAQGRDSVRPDQASWLGRIISWCNASRPTEAEKLLHMFLQQEQAKIKMGIPTKPIDPRLFGSIVECYGKSMHPKAAARATGVLQLMRQVGLSPDVVLYTSIMNLVAKSALKSGHDPALHVENIFKEMVSQWEAGDASAKPNELTFTALLSSLVRSQQQDAFDKAEAYFEGMEQLGVNKNTYHYTTLMAGWARRGEAVKVERLFQELKRASWVVSSGQRGLVLNGFAHATRVQAWAKAGNADMAFRAFTECMASKDVVQEDGFNASTVYAQTIVALAQSSKESDGALISELLSKLRQQHEQFWNKNPDGRRVQMKQIRKALNKSKLQDKDRFLGEYRELEVHLSGGATSSQ